MMNGCTTIGTCSICRGPVVVPTVWMGTVPPTPTCGQCGAIRADHGPVIPMRLRRGDVVSLPTSPERAKNR